MRLFLAERTASAASGQQAELTCQLPGRGRGGLAVGDVVPLRLAPVGVGLRPPRARLGVRL